MFPNFEEQMKNARTDADRERIRDIYLWGKGRGLLDEDKLKAVFKAIAPVVIPLVINALRGYLESLARENEKKAS